MSPFTLKVIFQDVFGKGESRSVVSDKSSQSGSNTTDRILKFINENPSCHLRQIKKDLGLAMGTIQYHLDRLEKAGKIKSARHGLYKYYFSVNVLENEKNILQILSHETAREIIMFIIEKKNPTQSDIAEKINLSSPSVSWQINRLIQFNLVIEIREGKYKRYSLRGDSAPVVTMLKNYYPSIWDKWSNRLAELFLSLSGSDDK